MQRLIIAGGLAVLLLAAIAVIAVAGAAGGGSSSSQSAAPSGDAVVGVADRGLGRVLVDGRGRTLYLWRADTTSRSACSGACARTWPPETTAASARPGAGVQPGLVGLVRRGDGTLQLTYAGHPLYRFAGDRAPGQANGQEAEAFGATWLVVTPRGTAITQAG
jgi:predicted lipoprotein with Yx(FWY)xxD motif